MVWCFLSRRNILLNVGQNWVSIDELYPVLQERTRGPASQPPIHIAATHWSEEVARVGCHTRRLPGPRAALRHSVSRGRTQVGERMRKWDLQLKELGRMLILTVAQGNCGIDVLFVSR